jgi:transcription elongation factor S-II
MDNYNDELRSKVVVKLNSLLDNDTISRRIEKSIYNYIIQISKKKKIPRKWNNKIFRNLYLSKIRSIYSNIDENSYIKNKEFKNKILTNKIDPNNIGKLSVYDIYPEIWKELFDNKIKRDKLKYDIKPEAMTDVFKCRKCNSRSCSYYEVQTRSADEPMTQFINCLDCGNRWRQ